MSGREENVEIPKKSSRIPWATVIVLGVCLAWAYWPIFGEMAGRWQRDPHYTHGFLVPLFGAALLWIRRGQLSEGLERPGRWTAVGLALIASGAALRLAGAFYYVEWFAGLSLLPTLAGAAALIGGRTALKWSLPSIIFLFFMVPLPYRIERLMGAPLQSLATRASTYALQTLGLPAFSEGNIILMGEHRIGVVEACNGLGVMFTFFAFTVGTVMIIRRPWLDKAIILMSAVPFAILANVARITLTGVAHKVAGGRVADMVFHDLAGWLMMPMTLVLLWLELALLARLLVEQESPDGPGHAPVVPVGIPVGAGSPRARGPELRSSRPAPSPRRRGTGSA